jgi:lysozyme
MALSVSRNGVLFTGCREAIVLVPYPDGPNLAIGCGHNSAAVRPGDRITVKDALALLKRDLAALEPRLNKELKAPVSQQQFDCLADLNFNTGNRFVWQAVKLINDGKADEVPAFLMTCDYNLAGEHKAGLLKRRMLEIAVYTHCDYGQLDPLLCWAGDPHTTKPTSYYLQPGDI